mmetsp:Transcript_2517/g.3556  ORF Transcript_2517/g.3556 Transcript_2517/m.3556 type:complete len:594 (-) Transcript_2517:999-2780(-)
MPPSKKIGNMSPLQFHDFELKYADCLYDEAMKDAPEGDLNLPSAVAADFLSRSGLNKKVLRSIWKTAKSRSTLDDVSSGSNDSPLIMTRNEFYIATRLIQLHQNDNVKSDDSIHPIDEDMHMNPPFFEGISETDVKMLMTSDQCDDHSESSSSTENTLLRITLEKEHSVASMITADTGFYTSSNTIEKLLPKEQEEENSHPPESKINYSSNIVSQKETQENNDNNNNNEQTLKLSVKIPLHDETKKIEKPSEPKISRRDPYVMTEKERNLYGIMFDKYKILDPHDSEIEHVSDRDRVYWDGRGGYMYVEQALQILTKANLSREQIGVIWDIVASDPDSGRLNRVDFLLVMHLVKCVARRNLPIPNELPRSLYLWRNKVRADEESCNKNDDKPPDLIESGSSSSSGGISPDREKLVLNRNKESTLDSSSTFKNFSDTASWTNKLEREICSMREDIKSLRQNCEDNSLKQKDSSDIRKTTDLEEELIQLKKLTENHSTTSKKHDDFLEEIQRDIDVMIIKEKTREKEIIDLQNELIIYKNDNLKLENYIEEMQAGMMSLRNLVDTLSDDISLLRRGVNHTHETMLKQSSMTSITK